MTNAATAGALPIVDFRVRPAVGDWMDMYAETPGVHRWGTRGYEAPTGGDLSDFITDLVGSGVGVGVVAGRQSWLGDLPNDLVAEWVTLHPDVLVGLAGVDPTTGPLAVAELERAVGELGLLGLALDPPDPVHGPAPRGYDDREVMFPIYEAADDLGIPVVLTVGPMVGRADDPWAIDAVASNFPGLTLVCSHGIWPRTAEWVAVAEQNANVYLETSVYLDKPGCHVLYEAMNRGSLRHKVLYASAYPFHPLDTATSVGDLPIDEDVRVRLLRENALDLLHKHRWEKTP